MVKQSSKPLASINVLYSSEDILTKQTQVIFDVDLTTQDIKKGTIQVIFLKYTLMNSDAFSRQFSWVSNVTTELSDTPDWIRERYPGAVTYLELKKLGELKLRKFTKSDVFKRAKADSKEMAEIKNFQKGIPKDFIMVIDLGEEIINCYIPNGRSRFYVTKDIFGWDFARINIKGQLGKLIATQKVFKDVPLSRIVQRKSSEST